MARTSVDTAFVIGNHTLGEINPCANLADVKHFARELALGFVFEVETLVAALRDSG